VDDAADAAIAALDRPAAAAGQVFNVGEATTWSIRGWLRAILAAAGHEAELVRVPDAVLPDDLRLTRAIPQHLLVTSRKATELLDWHPRDPGDRLVDSVRWHLANPPTDASTDFTADDAALATTG